MPLSAVRTAAACPQDNYRPMLDHFGWGAVSIVSLARSPVPASHQYPPHPLQTRRQSRAEKTRTLSALPSVCAKTASL